MYSALEELGDILVQVIMLLILLACVLVGLLGCAAIYRGLVWVIAS